RCGSSEAGRRGCKRVNLRRQARIATRVINSGKAATSIANRKPGSECIFHRLTDRRLLPRGEKCTLTPVFDPPFFRRLVLLARARRIRQLFVERLPVADAAA